MQLHQHEWCIAICRRWPRDADHGYVTSQISRSATGPIGDDAASAPVDALPYEARLAEMAEQLERSNAALEQFVYVASHDLSEPLRTVAGFVQLLADRYQGQLDADADEYIEFALDGVKRMQAMIQELLTRSRAGRPPELTG
jgi:signal transduction histidine kinase